MTQKIANALNNLKAVGDGRTTEGTCALVESVRQHTGLTIDQIAKLSGCSTAGVQRWRTLDRGKSDRLASLINYAQNLVNVDARNGAAHGNPVPAPNDGPIAKDFSEKMKSLRISDLEKALSNALQILVGQPTVQCDISKFETRDGHVVIELNVK